MNSRYQSRGSLLHQLLAVCIIFAIMLAIAIPRYIQINMRLNMGIVEQHLRVIGEQMKLVAKNGAIFPEDMLSLGTSKHAKIITSSLKSIEEEKGYQIQAYQISSSKKGYVLRICPKKGKWGISGDRCFALDQIGTRALNPWEGTGLTMNLFASNVKEEQEVNSEFSGILNEFLSNQTLMPEEKIDLLANQFEKTAYRLDFKRQQIKTDTDAPTSTLFYFSKKFTSTYNRLIPDVFKKLHARGIYLYQEEITPEQIARRNKNTQWGLKGEIPTAYLKNRPDMKAIEIGFDLKNQIDTTEELRQRLKSVGKTVEDWLFE